MDWATRVDTSYINAFGLIFNNDNGFVGGVDNCTLTANFRDLSAAIPQGTIISGTFSTAGQSYSGFTNLDPNGNGMSPFAMTAFLNDTDQYGVRIDLYRAKGATCNPTVWATYAEEIIQ
jgi:hypothetical protein